MSFLLLQEQIMTFLLTQSVNLIMITALTNKVSLGLRPQLALFWSSKWIKEEVLWILLLRVSAHRHFVFLQNFVKSSLGRIFAKDLRFCEQLLRKIKVNTIAEEGRTWKKGSKSSPLLCNFLRQIQFLNFKIWTSQEACCLSYHFFKYKPNFTKFCTDTKPVSANSLNQIVAKNVFSPSYNKRRSCWLRNCVCQ